MKSKLQTGVELESFVPRERAQGGGGGRNLGGVNPPPLAPVVNQPAAIPGTPNTGNNPNGNVLESTQVDDQIVSIPIKVVVKGDFYQILGFLDKALSIPRIIRLHEIYFRRDEGTGSAINNQVPPGGIPLNAQGQPVQPAQQDDKKENKKLSVELTFMSYSQKIINVPFAGFEPPAQ